MTELEVEEAEGQIDREKVESRRRKLEERLALRELALKKAEAELARLVASNPALRALAIWVAASPMPPQP